MSRFPQPDAGPAQVRAYLVDVLTLRHDTSTESAQKIADLWHLGRGVDLRQATLTLSSTQDTFTAIFGDAVGPFLHRSVREQLRSEWRASMPGFLIYWGLIGLPVLGALLLIRAWRQPTRRQQFRSLFHAGWVFGPPLWVFGFFGMQYTDLAPMGIVLGTMGFFLLFVAYISEMDALRQEKA